ncbi:hypothetical protein [Nocardia sp. R7R-8]|uniref:hypothetical protein n=1 Tax=Nocardia sp. R7R-8 TaxID=3459304 RepID=UPI00403DF14B
MNPNSRDNLIALLARSAAEVAEVTQLEYALRGPGSADAAMLEQMLPSLIEVAHQLGDLQVFQAVSNLPTRPASTPYRLKEIAELVGSDGTLSAACSPR